MLCVYFTTILKIIWKSESYFKSLDLQIICYAAVVFMVSAWNPLSDSSIIQKFYTLHPAQRFTLLNHP